MITLIRNAHHSDVRGKGTNPHLSLNEELPQPNINSLAFSMCCGGRHPLISDCNVQAVFSLLRKDTQYLGQSGRKNGNAD